ncbi:class I SAM-dependent methyltransferase [Stackebrandtia nassauensis]|uniref:Methyltransferase small n=1 Tax=Stackebrandtia nassauensis (strain DSM 44728 / CIP 108903 / NRRL B-16338 / NBRC 102104 / LLR-40K-21) TaxID=446470 RepID=D3QBB4_STANL|nr:methyltransferase [Stackebrandtia nassauensis]ADD40931.1 methyltransferase small [Stackebrandtia nassauensis DSM 44728]
MTEAEHYFTQAPASEHRERTIEFSAAGRDFALTTSQGVFSSSRLDPGTAVLLRKAPLPGRPGAYLDLGCGYGPVTMALAESSGGEVTAVDVNERARQLTADNAHRLGFGDRVRVYAPEEVPPGQRFDEIWSNPPIRVGKEALHELLLEWLPRLKPDGVAWLVVARHKGGDSLAGWLAGQGFPAEKHASQKGYRVLRVVCA